MEYLFNNSTKSSWVPNQTEYNKINNNFDIIVRNHEVVVWELLSGGVPSKHIIIRVQLVEESSIRLKVGVLIQNLKKGGNLFKIS